MDTHAELGRARCRLLSLAGRIGTLEGAILASADLIDEQLHDGSPEVTAFVARLRELAAEPEESEEEQLARAERDLAEPLRLQAEKG